MQTQGTPEEQNLNSSTGAPEPVSKAEKTSEPSVTTPDAWLECRLRVFERALNALEAKAEITARQQAQAIALLEARLSAPPVPEPVALVAEQVTTPGAELHGVERAAVAEPEMASAAAVEQTMMMVLSPPPPGVPTVVEEESSGDSKEAAKEDQPIPTQVGGAKAFPMPAPKEVKADTGNRARWLAIAAAALVAVFIGVGLSLGKNGGDATARESDGVAHRQVASTQFHKTMALADAGNPRAQARLALAYLRGQGTAGDADAALLWTQSAARAGNPVAQYLLGALYQQGEHVKTDPHLAFAWFARGAEKGNLKAMHNLAIAYAQGLGTEKNEARAAEWFTRGAERGYVDSAFDLAVLYERGAGVPQDLKQALKWYGVAALAGDQPSKERADFLRGQMKAADIKLATNAAMAFSPLPALEDANSL
jgi:TPR repeat protein